MIAQLKNKLCPLVKNPLDNCYCLNLNSSNINPAIHYCGNHYRACEIFKKKFGAGPGLGKLLSADRGNVTL